MRNLFLLCILFLSFNTHAQHVFNGKISDKNTGEPLIGATILYADGVGTVSNFDGQFELRLKKGTYTITASYVGYQAYQKEIRIDRNTELNISLKTTTLSEVEVVADVAIDRKTPVAFSTIPAKKIEEELAGQDMPCLLYTSPSPRDLSTSRMPSSA